VTSVASLAIALLLALWRPDTPTVLDTKLPSGAVAYSAERLGELRRSGQDVFVDVTADWCITCLANKRAVLDTDAIRSAFEAQGVTYMVADWTDYDPQIAEFVESHGRSGIPLYVMYKAEDRPKVLPQILRKKTVLDALDADQQSRRDAALASID